MTEGNGEKSRLEEQLKISKELYKTLIMTSPDAVSATDLQGNFTFVSPQTLELHGYTEEELLQKNSIELIHPSQHDRALKGFDIILEKGELRHLEYTLIRKDGSTFEAELNVSLIKNPSGDPLGYIATVRDVTQRKDLEEKVRQIEKMEAVGQLAGKFAHDFNNFLLVIKGHTELLRNRDLDHDTQNSVAEIQKAEENSEFLMKQLLAFSRKQLIRPIRMDLNSLIEDTKKTIRACLREDIELELDLTEGPYTIKADPVQLIQIVINTTINARDAITGSGKVSIKTSNVFLNEKLTNNIELELKKGNYLELSISDSGCGIPKEVLEHIFEPFFTTKEEGKGTGLGLASVYGIVKQSNGYIFVDTEIGSGTTFRIYFPQVEGEPENGVLDENNGSLLLRGRNEKVLLVEDEDLVRTFVEACLSNNGYRVVAAKDSKQAFSRIKNCRKLDILITDVILPKMAAREMASQITESHPNLKTLYISGYSDNIIAHHGIIEEGLNFLQKPFTTKELLAKLREMVD
jgi:PAS domain S-box-containing protein